MVIENDIKTRKIELVKSDQALEYYPSYQIRVRFEIENLNGNYNNFAWIRKSDLERFLLEIDRLDQNRKGAAILQGMSPGQFILTFASIDDLGHLGVKLEFRKSFGGDYYSFAVKIEFEIDPTSLPRIATELKLLMSGENAC